MNRSSQSRHGGGGRDGEEGEVESGEYAGIEDGYG